MTYGNTYILIYPVITKHTLNNRHFFLLYEYLQIASKIPNINLLAPEFYI